MGDGNLYGMNEFSLTWTKRETLGGSATSRGISSSNSRGPDHLPEDTYGIGEKMKHRQ
jgi:hypothetical protein